MECYTKYIFHIMKSRLATYLTSIIMAMVMMLSPGFDVCADTYDFETEIELTESISPTSVQENIEQPKTVENKQNSENLLVIRNHDGRRIIEHNTNPVNKQKIFCNYRE